MSDTHDAPSVFIQYKGTDICLDFTCACGHSAHYDGYMAYTLRCPECGRFFAMEQFPRLTEVPAEKFAINMWDDDALPDYYENPEKYPRLWKEAPND